MFRRVGDNMAETKYSKKFKKELLVKFEKYIEETEIPVIAEFAYMNKIPRTNLYDFEEFKNAIKICTDKKEANLEKKALNKEVDSSMAIFSLKQLGWTDKKESSVKAEITNPFTELSVEELKALARDEND